MTSWRSTSIWNLIAAGLCVTNLISTSLFAADGPASYETADPALRVVTLDSADTESFLAVRLDTTGRMFVGGREALFVYEPLPDGK